MTIKDLAEDYIAYNVWANEQIIRWLQSSDPRVLTTACASSFSNIANTLYHIWDAQTFYYNALTGNATQLEWNHTITDLFNGIQLQSECFLNYVTACEKRILLEEVTIQSKFVNGSFLKYELILHCVNHATYHRGQIITICHQLGLNKPPLTDFIIYLMEKQK